MKSICLIAVFVGALVACVATCATADELDDLLYGEPASGQQPAAPLAIEPESSLGLSPLEHDFIEPNGTGGFTDPNSTGYGDVSHWRPTGSPPSARVSINKTAADVRDAAHRARTAEALPPNPVPEPSAVILGGLALLYFLIFGRRRRIA